MSDIKCLCPRFTQETTKAQEAIYITVFRSHNVTFNVVL